MTVNRNGVDQGAIPKRLVTTKGDIIGTTANAIPARLGVGGDGETLVADSSTSTGLAYKEDYAAGKNKIINGDFRINQRGFTSATTDSAYGFDRTLLQLSGGTGTYSAQTFTLGTAPVAGYESINFARLDVTVGNDFCTLRQKIEDVRTLAGQTATVSFWAKGTNPTTAGNLSATLVQNFGTGGSPSSNVTLTAQDFVLTGNWVRYSLTFNIPSISGKTLGTNNNSHLILLIGQASSVSTDAWTLDLWGVQLEEGSVATAFNTATGTIQGELGACMRYYQTSLPVGITTHSITTCQVVNAQNIQYTSGIRFAVPMRVAPTVTIFSRNNNSGKMSSINTGVDVTGTSQAINIGANQIWGFENTSTAFTAGVGFEVSFNASSEL